MSRCSLPANPLRPPLSPLRGSKRLTLCAALFAILLLSAACTGRAPETGLNGGPTPLPAVKADGRIIADGHVLPIHSADLSFSITGSVSEVLVAEGDVVELGQPLVRLTSLRQQASVSQAEADVQRARARLDQVKAGSRSQEIDAARAGVDIAQAKLDALKTGPSGAQIAAAQANVAQAQAAVEKAQAGPNAADIAAAKADMDNAAAQLRLAQAAYDRLGELPDIGARPEAIQLEKATNEYNAAKARYESANRGPNESDIASARAQLDRARAELQQLQEPPRPADIAAAEAEVRRAQSQLDLLMAGAQPEEVRAAEADVTAAEAALAQAQAALAETELRAPFAGQIAAVDISVGQQVGPGISVVQLGDFSTWIVQTRDLTELRVVGVRPGDRATIAFDAIPDLELPGQVTRIRSIGQNNQGDITYTVIILPDRKDDRLLWNMTAKVIIEPGSGQGQVTGPAATLIAPRPTELPSFEKVTETPTSAATPTAAPTATDESPAAETAAPTAPPPTQAPASTPQARTQPTAAPTATTAVVAVAPTLLEPKNGQSSRQAVVFRWQPNGPLPPDAFYEVVWWGGNEGPEAARGLAAPTTKLQASFNIDLMISSGQLPVNELFWTVLIVRKDPYTRLTQPTAEGAFRLVWAGPTATPPPKPKT